MCGRYSRGRPRGLDYVEPLMTDAGDPRIKLDEDLFRPSWNVAPSTKQPILGPDGARLEPWGYRPGWAVARKTPLMVNARLDKAGSSAWKSMWKKGRVLVPADGWYEWIAEEGKKQPYYIQPIDGQPLFFAGLTSTTFGMEPRGGETYGYVIVTDASSGGMLDVHDRRPLALSPDEARQWLDPETPYETATHLANNAVTRPENFRWFRVSPAVNKVGNNEPTFNEPIDDEKP